MSMQHHENFSRGIHGRGPSDANFGWVFTAAFLIFGLWPLIHGRPVRFAWLAASATVLLVTLVRPSLLHPANRLWTGLGLLLGKVMNPLITGLLFFAVFTPVALFLRWRKKDLLALVRNPEAETYWVTRTAPNEPSSMVNQF